MNSISVQKNGQSENEMPVCPERMLWLSVIARALEDVGKADLNIGGQGDEWRRKRGDGIQAIAVRWIFEAGNQSDFLWVCDMADVCPMMVRHRASEIMDEYLDSQEAKKTRKTGATQRAGARRRPVYVRDPKRVSVEND